MIVIRDSGKTRQQYDGDLADIVNEQSPSLVVLAGWMHVLGKEFLDKVGDKIINLHPALPGQFPGVNAIARAYHSLYSFVHSLMIFKVFRYEAFNKGEIKETGVMIHKVIPEIDAGEVVLTQTVPIFKEDTLEQLEQRMHEAEHKVIVDAIKKVLGYANLLIYRIKVQFILKGSITKLSVKI